MKLSITAFLKTKFFKSPLRNGVSNRPFFSETSFGKQIVMFLSNINKTSERTLQNSGPSTNKRREKCNKLIVQVWQQYGKS